MLFRSLCAQQTLNGLDSVTVNPQAELLPTVWESEAAFWGIWGGIWGEEMI